VFNPFLIPPTNLGLSSFHPSLTHTSSFPFPSFKDNISNNISRPIAEEKKKKQQHKKSSNLRMIEYAKEITQRDSENNEEILSSSSSASSMSC
jgi:hypothetical protein